MPDLSSATDDASSTTAAVGMTAIGLPSVSATDSATSGPATTDASSGASTTGDAGDASTDDPTASEPETTETTTSPTTESSSSEPFPSAETGGDGCRPERSDDECSLCMKASCCPEVIACDANPDCDCLIDCLIDMGIVAQQACIDVCLVQESPPEIYALQTCQATMGCLADCV